MNNNNSQINQNKTISQLIECVSQLGNTTLGIMRDTGEYENDIRTIQACIDNYDKSIIDDNIKDAQEQLVKLQQITPDYDDVLDNIDSTISELGDASVYSDMVAELQRWLTVVTDIDLSTSAEPSTHPDPTPPGPVIPEQDTSNDSMELLSNGIERWSRESSIHIGSFNADFRRSFDFAAENNLPFVGIWTNGTACSYCNIFGHVVNTDIFTDWRLNSGIVFYLGTCEDGKYDNSGGTGPSDDGQEGYHGESFYWCRDGDSGKSLNYPYVRCYWNNGAVDVVNSAINLYSSRAILGGFCCSKNDTYISNLTPEERAEHYLEIGDYHTYNPSARLLVENFNTIFIGWFNRPAPSGG